MSRSGRQDAAEFPVETSLNPPIETVHTDLVSRVVRDASMRKVAEDQFRSNDAVFHLMVNNIKDYGIIMLNAEGRIVTWNAGAQTISGYQADEVVGKHFSLFYPAIDIEHDKPIRGLAAANSTGRFEDDGWRVRKDGSCSGPTW